MAQPPILSLALPSETGRVLSIQSHTVQGYVGNKSAVFPLQLLGYDVDPINSVQFSNHTGYPTFRGQVLDGQQLWDLIEGLGANNLLHYTHLLTVYHVQRQSIKSKREAGEVMMMLFPASFLMRLVIVVLHSLGIGNDIQEKGEDDTKSTWPL